MVALSADALVLVKAEELVGLKVALKVDYSAVWLVVWMVVSSETRRAAKKECALVALWAHRMVVRSAGPMGDATVVMKVASTAVK